MKKVNLKSTSKGENKNNNVKKKEKNYKIQMLRAFAIIMVLLSHTSPDGWIFKVYCRPICNLSVGVFVFLSGYLTKTENENWFSFCKKRILKVLIPYIIWSLLYSFFSYKDLNQVLFNLITTKSAGTLYYIFVYIQLVLLTPVLSKIIKSKYRWTVWLISPISLLIFKYYFLISGVEMNYYVSLIWDVCSLGWISYYYLGLLIGNKLTKIKFNYKAVLVLFIISIPLQMLEGYWFHIMGDFNCGTQLKFTSLISSSLFSILCYYYITNDKYKYKNKLLVFIGDCSFGIYLSMIFVIRILIKLKVYSYLPFGISSLVVLLICILGIAIGKKILGEKFSKYLGLS